MTTYDELKANLQSFRRELLKWKDVQQLSRKMSIYSNLRSHVISAIGQVNDQIKAAIRELASSYALELYISKQLSNLGLKQVEFEYSDGKITLDGLDATTHEVPNFPQMKITDEELNELTSGKREFITDYWKSRVLLRVAAENSSSVGEPDEEDALFAYFYAQGITPLSMHTVDYSSIFGEDIIFEAPFYTAIDAEMSAMLKLIEVEAYSYLYGWAWSNSLGNYQVILGLDVQPTLKIADASDETKVRKTTSAYLLNAYNYFSFDVAIVVDGYVVPVPANKHVLVAVMLELTGFGGITTLKSVEL